MGETPSPRVAVVVNCRGNRDHTPRGIGNLGPLSGSGTGGLSGTILLPEVFVNLPSYRTLDGGRSSPSPSPDILYPTVSPSPVEPARRTSRGLGCLPGWRMSRGFPWPLPTRSSVTTRPHLWGVCVNRPPGSYTTRVFHEFFTKKLTYLPRFPTLPVSCPGPGEPGRTR